ncbi:MAG: PDZ domain-containing protein [Saprospiraceae bacterium]|nr:PDZ domain-containing protein [Saprospiraceae bacterium]
MKNISKQRLGLLAMLLLFCAATLPAQEKHRVTIIKKSAFENGDAEKRIDEVALINLQDKMHRITEINLNNDVGGIYLNRASEHRNPCRVFIGVGTSSVSGGLKVDYTIDDTPAKDSGVQPGDVILTLDGVAVSTQSELIRERDKHQQGDAFTLSILRDGKPMTVNARFKSCSEEDRKKYEQQQEALELSMESLREQMKNMPSWSDLYIKEAGAEGFMKMEMKERPILGVYEDESVNEPGLVIGEVIEGKGAEAAGLQSGDVITSVAGQKVTGAGTLRSVLNGREPGERVAVIYQRDGETRQTEVALSTDRHFRSYTIERDPCAVFIGVYTSDQAIDGQGLRVTGIVDNTPAKQSGIQPGDVILALDHQPVSTYQELVRERNKHQPGDPFSLKVVRDGEQLTIDAVFKSCPKPGETASPVEDVVKMPAEQRNDPTLNQTLPLESLEAYPNPTAGPLNVRFEAEAVPTTVRIMDASGRVVYSKVLDQFDGYFSEQINLNGTPGIYTLSVQQGKKMNSRSIVLLPRA